MNRQDSPEDLFDVFEPWNRAEAGTADRQPERPPWEPPPPPPAPAPPPEPESDHESEEDSGPEPFGSEASFTPEGAVEPGRVLPDQPSGRKNHGRVGPRIPDPTPPPPRPDPEESPGAFVRAVGVPEVSAILGRLEDDGHRGNIQDLLDLPTPAMRVLLWPKPSPLSRTDDRILATLELLIEPRRVEGEDAAEETEGKIISHYYFGPREDLVELKEIPLSVLSREWIVEQVLDFVKVVLLEQA